MPHAQSTWICIACLQLVDGVKANQTLMLLDTEGWDIWRGVFVEIAQGMLEEDEGGADSGGSTEAPVDHGACGAI